MNIRFIGKVSVDRTYPVGYGERVAEKIRAVAKTAVSSEGTLVVSVSGSLPAVRDVLTQMDRSAVALVH